MHILTKELGTMIAGWDGIGQEMPRVFAPSLHQTMLLTPKMQLGNSMSASLIISWPPCAKDALFWPS